MLRINLATRPLYNEHAVRFGLTLVGLIGLIGLIEAVVEISVLSKSYAALEASGSRNEDRTQTLAAEALSVRERAGGGEAAVEARDEANGLIERRVFSWTRFFNLIDQNIPANLILTSVRPDITDSEMTVRVGVVGREVADIVSFIEELEATGNFLDILVQEEEVVDGGRYRALLVGRYAP
jgi:hypothetical protein